jgi:hypothetical protein
MAAQAHVRLPWVESCQRDIKRLCLKLVTFPTSGSLVPSLLQARFGASPRLSLGHERSCVAILPLVSAPPNASNLLVSIFDAKVSNFAQPATRALWAKIDIWGCRPIVIELRYRYSIHG